MSATARLSARSVIGADAAAAFVMFVAPRVAAVTSVATPDYKPRLARPMITFPTDRCAI